MPTPSVAFNLTCAFNPGSAKLLFNVEEHGVFGVTRKKCISNMQSKSDPMFCCCCVFFSFFWSKGTKQHHSKEERNQYVVLTHLSPQGSQEDISRRLWQCVCLRADDGVINCVSLLCVCVFSAARTHADHAQR